MRYWIVASDPSGEQVTINYGRGDAARKARDKALYSKGGLAALAKLGLTGAKPWNDSVPVQKTNAMTGAIFYEDEDTSYYLSPSSETYWSA